MLEPGPDGGGGGRCGSGDSCVADLKNAARLLAPKGSVASGRIIRLERHPDYFVLQIEFQDLDWPGGHARLKLSFDRTGVRESADRTAQPDGAMVISRQAGPRLSGILMFWRSE